MAELIETHRETAAEETASSITHALGVLLSAAGLCVMLVLASGGGGYRRIITVSIYGSTLLLMYLASTCYHLVRKPKLKRVMRVLDHSSIFLLIAGTYTPIVLVSMRGGWGWSLFGVEWGLAIAGVAFKMFFIERWESLSLSIYLLMAWIALVAIKPLLATLPMGGIVLLFCGGVVYTAGVGFYLWKQLPFNHAIWHLFVLGGSICHFFAVLLYVLPLKSS